MEVEDFSLWLNHQLTEYVYTLSTLGVDIDGFGRYCRLRLLSTSTPWPRYLLLGRGPPDWICQILALEYGPRPEDWKVWVADETYEDRFKLWSPGDFKSGRETGHVPGVGGMNFR